MRNGLAKNILSNKFNILSIFAGFVLMACGPQTSQVSKPLMAPEMASQDSSQSETSPENKARSEALQKEIEQYFKSLPPLEKSLTPEQKADIEKSNKDLEAAKNKNYEKHTSDGDPMPVFNQPGFFENMLETSTTNKNTNAFCLKLGATHCLDGFKEPKDQAVGYYYFNPSLGRGGQLLNSSELPQNGEGYHQKSNSIRARWATEHAVKFAQGLGSLNAKNHWGNKIVFGDFSAKNGGYLFPHISHQDGLDMDIGILTTDNSNKESENFPVDMISKNKISKKFDVEKNWQMISSAINSNWTYFVLAHPSIKKAFCDYTKAANIFKESEKILSQISPDVSHWNHFHIRLKCPITSPRCIPGPIRPADSGC